MIATDFGCGIIASLADTDIVSSENFTKIDENIFRRGDEIAIVGNGGAIVVKCTG